VDLLDVFRIMRDRWRVVCGCTLAGIVLALSFTLISQPVYESHLTLLVSGQALPTGDGATTVQSDVQNEIARDLAKTYAELIRTRPVAEAVVQRLHLSMSPAHLEDRLRADTTPDTSLVNLHATADSAAKARDIAQATAEVFIQRVASTARPDGALAPVRLDVVEPASLPTGKVSPRPLNNLAVGCLLGILVGLALAVFRDNHDERLRDADQLRRTGGLAVLGIVPRIRRSIMSLPAVGDSAPLAEAYRQVRTRVFAPGVTLPRSLLIAGPLAGDGKTTTACYLAAAVARTNRRVVLVDADLRRPRVAQFMGLAGETGLVDVLGGQVDLESAVQPWGPGALHVLAAGEPPAEPSELLASPSMARLLRELRQSYEVVIIDSPAITSFTDAEILSTLVDEVLLALRFGTPLRRIEEAVHNLSLVSANILGVVVTMASRHAALRVRPMPPQQPGAPSAPRTATSGVTYPQVEPAREVRVLDGNQIRVIGVAQVPKGRKPDGNLRELSAGGNSAATG
jgi:capsular exopolysaccharide synthesis family protein